MGFKAALFFSFVIILSSLLSLSGCSPRLTSLLFPSAKLTESGAEVLTVNGDVLAPNRVLWVGSRSYRIPAEPSRLVVRRSVVGPRQVDSRNGIVLKDQATEIIDFTPKPGRSYIVMGRGGPIEKPKIWISEQD